MLTAKGYFTIWSNYWQMVTLLSCFIGSFGLHSRSDSISNSNSSCFNSIYSITLQKIRITTFKDNISALWEASKERQSSLIYLQGLNHFCLSLRQDCVVVLQTKGPMRWLGLQNASQIFWTHLKQHGLQIPNSNYSSFW